MNRIEKTFKKLKAQDKKAFIPYIMAGDPSTGGTIETVLLLEKCGADIIEIGVPFTDPLADGPTIQRAAERALKAGVTLRKVISLVAELREATQIPVVLMTYYNPVFKYGEERFVADAVNAGADGVIIPDLPPDEAQAIIKTSKRKGLATVFLLAPTSTYDRIRLAAKASRGFIYYVPITGITGASLLLDDSIKESVNNIKNVSDKPVAVGFGISGPAEARAIAAIADGVIVGSAIVKKFHEQPEEVEKFIKSLREAI